MSQTNLKELVDEGKEVVLGCTYPSSNLYTSCALKWGNTSLPSRPNESTMDDPEEIDVVLMAAVVIPEG